ncbi:hypothetical protein CERZMDRAFT_89892, partial [Cercospora zeae-maydis SCOH1-5]
MRARKDDGNPSSCQSGVSDTSLHYDQRRVLYASLYGFFVFCIAPHPQGELRKKSHTT